MDSVLNDANQKIQNAIEHLKKELSTIRAGRANPSLIENLPVSVYGSQMKLMEVGTISAPQHSLLTVSIWDASIVKDVEKAILEANIGLNPAVDGQTIRLPIPALTEERRAEFVKQATHKGEEAKVSIRQIRADERSKWEMAKEANEFGEDELFRRQKLLQELIDKTMGSIDELVKAKEEELRQI
ncbi:ribosome recycling factor [Candidatus Daviesbacteria bacterium]|nr:ribosome recycling factor [Candidatus Daviesbacteria bacterium]